MDELRIEFLYTFISSSRSERLQLPEIILINPLHNSGMIPAFRMQWCSALPSPSDSAEQLGPELASGFVLGKGEGF